MTWIIRLQNLPLTAIAADIRAFFSGCRIPDGAVHIIGGPDGDAFIGFATDEDARQAMRYDSKRIHGEKVRLYLSSRMEMDNIIMKARSGGANSGAVAQAESVRRDEGSRSDATAQDIYAQRNGSSHALSAEEAVRQSESQHELSRGAPNDGLWTRTDAQSDSWKSALQATYDPRSQAAASLTAQATVAPWQDLKMLSALSHSGTAQPAARPPVYQQHVMRDQQDTTFHGYSASVQGVPTYSTIAQNGALDGRAAVTVVGQPKVDPLISTIYQQAGLAPPIIPGQPLQMPPTIPGLVIPPVVAPVAPQVAAPTTQTSAQSVPVMPTPNPFAPYPGQSVPIFPPMPVRRAVPDSKENCYVELSRLPSDLLRPASLEQFLRPSVPLTLSSVKVVFDPKGFPIHSLVRFENSKDAENILSRDGEQGIRIRACSKAAFDKAVDGSVQVPSGGYSGVRGPDRERERGRDSSRGTRGSSSSSRRRYSPERRGSGNFPRREERSGGRSSRERDEHSSHRSGRRPRSRSPPREYRDSKRRREEGDRFCIEATNLPFRVTEPEILEFFGPHCEPTKMARAFYSDGRASDRWVIEFKTSELAEKAYRTRGKVQNRLIRTKRLSCAEADELLSIPDKFGMNKKQEYERKQNAVTQSGGPAPLLATPSSSDATGDQNLSSFGQDAGRGRGRVYPRGFNGVAERDGLLQNPPAAAANANGPSTTPGNPQSSTIPSSAPTGGQQRFPGPRTARGNGPLIQGGPRPPLIAPGAPPTFFAAGPSSTVRQRGPPQGHQGSVAPSLNGPKPPAAAPIGLNTWGLFPNGSTAGNPQGPPKTCVVLANVPSSATDLDLSRFLMLPPARITQAMVKRMLDGTVYMDLGNVEDAMRAATRCNRQPMGDNFVLVTAITHEHMLESLQKKVAISEQKEFDPGLIASLGEPGTVISCHGFPPDVNFDDIRQFFDKYSLVETSVRIKYDDSSLKPTGECLLAVGTPQEAAKAVMLLSGRRLNGSTVTMTVVKPTEGTCPTAKVDVAAKQDAPISPSKPAPLLANAVASAQ